MIKDVKDFEGALKGFTDILKKIEKAESQAEVAALERAGRSAMREVQVSAGYIGYRLKDAVDSARARLNKNMWDAIRNASAEATIVETEEKPAEAKPVKKSTTKKATKKTTKKTTKKAE